MKYYKALGLILMLQLSILVLAKGQAGVKKTAPGYAITCRIKPYQNQWLYLAYHYGNIKAIADSAFVDASGKAVFKGAEPLQPGIYIMASPSKTILFELLLGKNQQFGITADTLNINNSLSFTGSGENSRFVAYTKFLTPKAMAAESINKKKADTKDPAELARLTEAFNQTVSSIDSFREASIKNYPEDMLTVLFKSMRDAKLPAGLKNPKTNADSLAQYRWAKAHYWEGVDFMDGRLVRTPILENKLKAYLNNWVIPNPDSLIYEFNWMIALGRNDTEMFRYLIGYFVDNYMYPKIMGQDKVFLHVYERFLSGDKPKVDWLNEKQMKTIRERAYMLMANQLGTQAWNMEFVDTSGKTKALYDVKARHTVVVFWDVNCGHCREEIPKMDTLFQNEWKKRGVEIYAVMSNEESVKDWPAYIAKHTSDWTHVHQTEAMSAAETKANKPGFRQLYDVTSTPTIFLLDSEKRILAKKIGLNDLESLLNQRFEQNK